MSDSPTATGRPVRYRVGAADRASALDVESVRRSAYRNAAEFDWHDEARLGWSAVDDASTVLAVWDDEGRLLSTVRATVIHEVAQAEAFLEYSLSGIEFAPPTLVFSRAATLPQAARQGLNSMIRRAYLEAALGTRINQLIMVVYTDGPRLRSLKATGFETFELRAGWDSEARARTPPVLASLSRPRFRDALDAMPAPGPTRGPDVDIESMVASFRAQCERACPPAASTPSHGAAPDLNDAQRGSDGPAGLAESGPDVRLERLASSLPGNSP